MRLLRVARAGRWHVRRFAAAAAPKESLTLSSLEDGVTTITMNNPAKYNGWTQPMMASLHASLAAAADDGATRAVVLTGAGKYYSAGVDLSGTIRPMWPRALRAMIYANNKKVFDVFLDFPKPLVVAVNGPAIGATVTTSTLADAIVASERATFSTPFARLGVPPEGCSSVHFARLMGADGAARMLGDEGWAPTAREALDAGLVTRVAAPDALLAEATELARELAATPGYVRAHMGQRDTAMMKRVNDAESHALADAFVSADFLRRQAKFLKSKGKAGPARVFETLVATRPLWAMLL